MEKDKTKVEMNSPYFGGSREESYNSHFNLIRNSRYDSSDDSRYSHGSIDSEYNSRNDSGRDYYKRRNRRYRNSRKPKYKKNNDKFYRLKKRKESYYLDPKLRKEIRSKLTDDQNQLIIANPHIEQCIQYEGIKKEEKNSEILKFSRFLNPKFPEKQYTRRKGHIKTVTHWGQRKLLLSEIEFLTNYSIENDVVIYAGSAPGTHTNYLSNLFPTLTFILVDPAEFHAKENEKIKINPDSEKGFFTDELANLYSTKYPKCLFISDIRTAQFTEMNESEIETHVLKDMIAQEKWINIMKPKWSMLKFRLPYCNEFNANKKHIDYLDGKVYFPVWGPITTSESRLITDGKNKKSYSFQKYEDQMFFFNTVYRTTLFDHLLSNNKEAKELGIDDCFDCRSEIFIISQYLKKIGKEINVENCLQMLKDFDIYCSKKGRKLKHGNIGFKKGFDIKSKMKILLSVDTTKDTDLKRKRDDNNNLEDEYEKRKKKRKTES